ncbi:hypothetical protein ACIA5G_46115 [Amycolatopsis sp. NPDC051758]|uniref:hypothetical protein n=1 Tax=Amycolatopsis sp. NPDC051758 TaxID=3363935 RepID=UPI0037BA414F
MARAAIETAIGETRVNTIRELGRLTDQGDVVVKGSDRATNYAATEQARRLALWDTESYLALEPDQREARFVHINQGLVTAVRGIFSATDLEFAHEVHDSFRTRRTADVDAAQRELERFVIERSWKSSKIEGNTYTLLDTEQLLREDVEAPGHSQAEAKTSSLQLPTSSCAR